MKDNHAKAFRTATIAFAAVAVTVGGLELARKTTE